MNEIRRSVCALDCPDTCSLLVEVDGNGRGIKLRGDPAHPVTRGFLCAKVAKYLDREYHPARLTFPQRRVGEKGEGRFERITWDEALGEIASRYQRISETEGPEAILPYSYAGTMGMLNGSGMDRRFFHRLGASQLDRTICASAGGTALLQSQGIRLGTEPEQFASSKLILAWGANILATNVHLWPSIVEARRRGAKLYVIDPVRTRTAKLADRHFAIFPGSDLALALGLLHVVFREGWEDRDYLSRYTNGVREMQELAQSYPPDRVWKLTGIALEDIESLARDYATVRPAAIRLNYGVQRSDRGGSAVRAIAALPVVTGSWREVGGGIQLTTSGAFEFNRTALERPDLQLSSPLKRAARIVNMAQVGSALTQLDDPPVKALFVYNSNPAAIAPSQAKVFAGLRRPDLFTVVLEHFQTDTADYADLLLPATTFLEHTDIYLAYGHYYLQLCRAALKPPGEARSNLEVFRSLSQLMGFKESCFQHSEDEMIRDLLNSGSPYLSGISLESLEQNGFVRLKIANDGEPFLPFAEGNFRTGSRKFEFGAESLDYTPPSESRRGSKEMYSRFPLELISPKNSQSLNSTFGHLADVDRQNSDISINPSDAAVRSISHGCPVRVVNDRGYCFCVARITEDVPPGVVCVTTMRWNRNSPGRRGVNQLTSETLTDIGAGPTFYSCLVDVLPESIGSAHD